MQAIGLSPNLVRVLASSSPDLLAEMFKPGKVLEAEVISVFQNRAMLAFGKGIRLEVVLQALLKEGQKARVQVQPNTSEAGGGLVLKLVQPSEERPGSALQAGEQGLSRLATQGQGAGQGELAGQGQGARPGGPEATVTKGPVGGGGAGASEVGQQARPAGSQPGQTPPSGAATPGAEPGATKSAPQPGAATTGAGDGTSELQGQLSPHGGQAPRGPSSSVAGSQPSGEALPSQSGESATAATGRGDAGPQPGSAHPSGANVGGGSSGPQAGATPGQAQGLGGAGTGADDLAGAAGRGETGSARAQPGATGTQGPTGTTGTQGQTGTTRPQGQAGTSGPQGQPAASGTQAHPGPPGAQGQTDPTGVRAQPGPPLARPSPASGQGGTTAGAGQGADPGGGAAAGPGQGSAHAASSGADAARLDGAAGTHRAEGASSPVQVESPAVAAQSQVTQARADGGQPPLIWLPIPLENGKQGWAQLKIEQEAARSDRNGAAAHQVRLWWETPTLGQIQVTLDAKGESLTALFTVLMSAMRQPLEEGLTGLQGRLTVAGFADVLIGCRQALPGECLSPAVPSESGARLDRRL